MVETIITPRRSVRRTKAEMAAAADKQVAVVEALRDLERHDVAARLERCMATRLGRRGDPVAARTWGYRCGKAGCSYCGRTCQHRAWRSCLRWCRGLAQRSLAVVPLPNQPGGLKNATAAIRRALRDIRDGEAVKSRRWLDVGFAGVVVGDAAWLVVVHDRLDRQEVARVVRRRWPAAQLSGDIDRSPPFSFTTADRVELALLRRGGEEPFKVVVGIRQVEFGQRHQKNAGRSVVDQPMPFIW